jgi:ubiquinone/menaquinone biosynthesis C-methylase UbiE
MKCNIAVPRSNGKNPTLHRDLMARARVARLACQHGGRALDVGTGACACMARILARCRLHVTAIDYASSAVHFAEQVAALRSLRRWLDVRYADAARMPFADASYGVVVAFDALGHSSSPERILAEMFRVCAANGVVLIAEYNRRGRQATRHLNFGFETRLAKMLRRYCSSCQRIEQPYHTTFVCRKYTEDKG